MKILSWNINVQSRHEDAKLRLVNAFDWDVLALQEVRPEAFDYFAEHLDAIGVYRTTTQRGDLDHDYGSALFVHNGHRVEATGLVTAMPFPERAVWADVVLDDAIPVHVVSFHSPNGVGHGGEIKMGAYAAVHAHVRTRSGATVLAFDGNWSWDCWPDRDDEAWADESERTGDNIWRWHRLLLAPDRFKSEDERSGIRDAWRDVLATDSGYVDRVAAIRPEGPTAVTFMNSPRGRVKAHRYDHVYVSEHVAVRSMTHHYADAIGAHSDHALVETTVLVDRA